MLARRLFPVSRNVWRQTKNGTLVRLYFILNGTLLHPTCSNGGWIYGALCIFTGDRLWLCLLFRIEFLRTVYYIKDLRNLFTQLLGKERLYYIVFFFNKSIGAQINLICFILKHFLSNDKTSVIQDLLVRSVTILVRHKLVT